MLKLTNDQRKCFALVPIEDHWECIEAKKGPYDKFVTYLYFDGDTIVKCILDGDSQYCEYELSEKVSPDRKYLLPKTAKGKPVLLSSSTILKRNGVGMCLKYYDEYIDLYNENTRCSYFSNIYLNDGISDVDGFSRWVEQWCNETTPSDIEDIADFSKKKRKHVKFKEGDVFRFRIGRRLYGYGRILLDYSGMRKNKEPFWDILMSKPLVCSAYHIATERDDFSVNELIAMNSLPSTIIADNSLFYGEFEIIGNIPIAENEDYPVLYGNSIRAGEKAVCYQCGKTFRKIDGGTELYSDFINNGVSFDLNLELDILLKCIEEKSNAPYWEHYHVYRTDRDLRNPKHIDKLNKIKKQFGL